MGLTHYCEKCGRICPTANPVCDVCNSNMKELPEKYEYNWLNDDVKQEIYNTLVKPSPEFDQYLFDHREEIRAKNRKEFQEWLNYNPNSKKKKSKSNNSSYQPHCPTCGSPNVTKISVTRKAVGAGLFGLFSKTARSQFQCSDCGYKW